MAKDKLHDIVEVALVKDGWINIKSITLNYKGTDLNVDIIADKLISAEKENLQIAVEVKSFGKQERDIRLPSSAWSIFTLPHGHLGINSIPYLALPEAIYTNYLTRPFFQDSISLHHVNLFTIDTQRQEIVRWNPSLLLP